MMNRYQIGEKLGEGGMGTVYRGHDTLSGDQVAVKVLKPEVAQPEMITRFIREGEMLRQLNHPNIVKMLAAKDHFIVMELVEGGSLADIIAREAPLPIERILDITIELADALTRAHHLKIIHRDLKPANVLIASDGTPRLSDFGVAYTGETVEPGLLMGTISYLSPELLSGKTPTALSDIWAFGVVLFEMLTGKHPFEGEQYYQIVDAILNKPIPDLEQMRPDAPLALIDLVYRMLVKLPPERIPSARLIGAELDAMRRGTSIRGFFETVGMDTPQIRHNLPAQTTAFVGRELEISELRRQLNEVQIRLITLLAPGGMGKTRLSLEVANRSLDMFPDGVFFVPLAPLASPDQIVTAIADAVNYTFDNQRPPQQQILDVFRDKHALLILDNFEHVLDGSLIVSELLKAAPQLKILATSREKLGLEGENVFLLEGMASASSQLFLQSAKRILPQFELKDADLIYIDQISELVSGSPLGLVLAAAWLETLSLAEITDEISKSLDFLESDRRDMPERQRSLRAVFDYSWQRLSDEEKAIFRRFSIFRGGCTRQAAQAITKATLRHLTTLYNKSLIRRNVESGRYQIHELLRQYAQEQLEQSGEADAIHDAHSVYYLNMLAERESDMKGRRQLDALDEIDADLENIRTAWIWAINRKNEPLLNASLEALNLFYRFRNRESELSQLVLKAAGAFEPSLLWARLMLRSTQTSFEDPDSRNRLENGFALVGDDKTETAYGLMRLASLEISSRNLPAAVELLKRSLALYHEFGDLYYASVVLSVIGLCHIYMGQFEATVSTLKESLQIKEKIGDASGAMTVNYTLAASYMSYGYFVEGDVYYEQSIAARRKTTDYANLVHTLALYAGSKLWQGDLEAADKLLTEARYLDTGEPLSRRALVTYSGMLACLRDQIEQAKVYMETGNAIATNNYTSLLNLAALKVMISLQLGDETATRLNLIFPLSFAIQFNNPLNVANGLALGAMLIAREHPQRSVELLSVFFNHPRSAKAFFEKWSVTRRVLADLKQQLGEDAYMAAWERGKKLDLKSSAEQLLAKLK